MPRVTIPPFLRWLCVAAGAALTLAGCGSTRPLPVYETPLARADFQTVRTTAYTHTEADHTAYGNHNALGGTLRAAAPDVALSASTIAVAPPVPIRSPGDDMEQLDEGGFHGATFRPAANVPVPETVVTPHSPGSVVYPSGPGLARVERGPDAGLLPYPRPSGLPTAGIGSAAADWSRWPAGTVFRIAATGQVYRVDDYGWALAGRNTIDLYQPTTAAMNAWGARRVDIQVLRWGDPAESLRMLRRHQEYRHIHRMVLELEGRTREAANLD